MRFVVYLFIERRRANVILIPAKSGEEHDLSSDRHLPRTSRGAGHLTSQDAKEGDWHPEVGSV
ncbi:hypothetical protein D4R75_14435 [bacterium]|nr:MAG: hypothetical protein D4R75_14435 [bacterium]